MKRREAAQADAGRSRLLGLALIGGPTPQARPDLADDLVLLGTHGEGAAFWPCSMWGSELHRTDFVHVAGPCRC